MPTSNFFNNYDSYNEQQLVEDLIVEAIRIYGKDVYYLPRTVVNYKQLYGEDNISQYNQACLIEMYPKNPMGFAGQGDLMSKFGIYINDTITFTVSKRVFMDEIGTPNNFPRPREGDLIYFPINKKIFVIEHVEHEAIFYQMGTLQTYDLQCELWEYSNEQFNTGILEIDLIQQAFSFAITEFSMLAEDGQFTIADEQGFPFIREEYVFGQQVGPYLEDNDIIETESNTILDFSETNPFGEV